jgi:two-component system response regulator LytT
MNIAIIEDEILTAEDLKEIILKEEPKANVVAVLHSVKEALAYFKTNSMPHLIFSDIQLGDGLSFDIFNAIDLKAPVIFCTAFDEYAIKAFNANGIHYVLKPFNAAKIREAIDKYHTLQDTFSSWTKSFENVFEALNLHSINQPIKKAESVLVYYQHRVIPIKLKDVAVFYIKNEVTYLYTFDHKTYIVSKTLDELQQLDTDMFYRANRQYIVSRNAVQEASHYLSRKVSITLNVPFSEIITISKEKITPFFDWLTRSA